MITPLSRPLQGNQHSYSNGPAMSGTGGADARYATFMQNNASAPAAQHHHSVLRTQTNPLPVVDGPLHQQMLARYSFNNSPPSLLDGQGPISHQELLELASCSNASNSHEYGSMGDVLCPLRPFPQTQGYSRNGQSSSGQSSDAQVGSGSTSGLDLGFTSSGPLLSGGSDTASADTQNPSGSLSPTTYALMFPGRAGSQGSGEVDLGFQVSSDLSSMDPGLFSRANYGRAPQVGGSKRASQQQAGGYHNHGYNPAITASNPGVQQGNNGNNGIVFYRSSVESRSDMSERCSLELANGGGDMGGHGVRSMSSEDSFRYGMGQQAPADSLSASAAYQRRSMNPDASVNPWATAAAIKVGMKAQRGSTGTEFPGHSKFMFANSNIEEQQASLDGPIGSDSDEVFGLRKGLDALVGSLRL